MKTMTIVVGLVLFLESGVRAQVTPSAEPALLPQQGSFTHDLLVPPERLDSLIRFQTDTVYKLVGVNFAVTGAVPQAIRSRKPWQMINPFAPPEYGSGFHNVSINPVTGRAEGIRLIGVGF